MTQPRAFVIGHPIGHSRSPLMHGYWLKRFGINGSYERRDASPEQLAGFFEAFRREGWIGANVAIPHKLAAMDHVDRIDEVARAMGAVNCIWWNDSVLVGGNTDAMGFIGNFDNAIPGWDAEMRRAVILGAGGAAPPRRRPFSLETRRGRLRCRLRTAGD